MREVIFDAGGNPVVSSEEELLVLGDRQFFFSLQAEQVHKIFAGPQIGELLL